MANKFTEKHKAVLVKTLKKYGNPEGIQNIYELEGFLVGALCCPDAVELDQMLFVIFGPEEDTYPKWGNQSEVESFFDSLFSLQNKNNALVHGASYKPKLLKDKKDHIKWCRGFVKGFGLKGFELADERFKEDSDIHDFMIFCNYSPAPELLSKASGIFPSKIDLKASVGVMPCFLAVMR